MATFSKKKQNKKTAYYESNLLPVILIEWYTREIRE